MIRWLLSILVLILVAIGILWQFAPNLISHTLSNKMQVAVNIGDIGLSSSQLSVKNIQIANPQGTLLPKALTVGAIYVAAPLTHFFKEAIVIDKIEINDIYLDMELTTSNSPSGNWAQIFANMQAPSAPSKPAQKKGGSLLIKQLILTNITGDIVANPLLGTSKKIAPIERLEFTNLSSDSGQTVEQIAQLILEKAIATTLEKEHAQNPLQKTLESLKGLLPK